MSILKLFKASFAALVFSSCVISIASASIIWDYSPDSVGSSQSPDWNNFSGSQNFGERVTFEDDGSISGMDIYSIASTGQPGEAVVIKIWEDNAGDVGSLITSFDSVISVVDSIGSTSLVNVTRRFAEFTYNFSSGSFWIGMSGKLTSISQQSLRDVFPENGQMAQFQNMTFDHYAPIGDMAFRLHRSASQGNIPEPAPMALLGLGLLGLGLARKRRN